MLEIFSLNFSKILKIVDPICMKFGLHKDISMKKLWCKGFFEIPNDFVSNCIFVSGSLSTTFSLLWYVKLHPLSPLWNVERRRKKPAFVILNVMSIIFGGVKSYKESPLPPTFVSGRRPPGRNYAASLLAVAYARIKPTLV